MNHVFFDFGALPPEDHEAARFIQTNLISLQTRAEDFRRTVDLYFHVREVTKGDDDPWRKVAWTKIAGRNGAIEAYAFSKVMELINEMPPYIRERMDRAKKREATKLFAAEFPRIAGIRNATAHPGQLSGDPKQLEQHRLREAVVSKGWYVPVENSGVFLGEGCSAADDHLDFSSTFQGKLASYELSYAKADVLDRCAQLYSETFYPLEHPRDAEYRRWTRENAERRQEG